jgi:hypothetical protein
VTGGLRIPATLEALPAWDRRQGSRLALPASNDLGGIDFVVVTDIGSRGARLVTPVPLAVGCEIRLKLPLLEPVHGSLVWVSSRLAGCEFLEPLHPAILRVLIAMASADPRRWRVRMTGESSLPG